MGGDPAHTAPTLLSHAASSSAHNDGRGVGWTCSGTTRPPSQDPHCPVTFCIMWSGAVYAPVWSTSDTRDRRTFSVGEARPSEMSAEFWESLNGPAATAVQLYSPSAPLQPTETHLRVGLRRADGCGEARRSFAPPRRGSGVMTFGPAGRVINCSGLF